MGISSPTPLRVGISARFITTISRSKDPEPWLSTTVPGKHGGNRTTRLSIIARLGSHSLPSPIPVSLHPRLSLSHPPLCSLFQPRFRPPLLTTASMTSSAFSDSKTVRIVIKGRVQGVFYRDWTVGNATELGLKGWVRNRRDGAVEALFSGDPAKVEEMAQRCRRGPPSAVVTGLEVFPCDDDPGSGFERKPTPYASQRARNTTWPEYPRLPDHSGGRGFYFPGMSFQQSARGTTLLNGAHRH